MNPWFNEKFLDFFKELASNNHKTWFDANRHRYQEDVRKPFLGFTDALIQELAKRDARLKQPAANCLFRINRDVRFSKNKDPYKIQMSAAISVNGKKDASGRLGLYFQFSPESLMFGGGAYAPDKKALQAMRDAIALDLAGFAKTIENPAFVQRFGSLKGEKNKRLSDPAHKASADLQPLLFNKQFYYMAEYPAPERLLQPDLLDWTLAHFDDAYPLALFMEHALAKA